MKIRITLIATLLAAVLLLFFFFSPFKKPQPAFYNYQESEEEEERESGNNETASFTEARAKYEYDMVKDPITGRLPKGIFEAESAFAKTLPVRSYSSGTARAEALNTYLPAGPNNFGGRTRAIAYDVRYNGSTNKVIVAGCVSGGIMRSTDGGNTWALVTPANEIHSFTAIAQDPRAGSQNTWYAGGGEFTGNSAAASGAPYLGYGIWKSTDNGATWAKQTLVVTDIGGGALNNGALEAFDHPFDIVHRIAVNPTNGHVYIAGHRRLVRSTDAGASFQVVFGGTVGATTDNGQMDVTISSTGKIFLAVNGGNPDPSLRGIWVSATGNAGSFQRIAGGQTLGVDSVANWRANDYTGGSKRTLITLAPSNNNIAYIYYENGLSASGTTPKPEADLFRLDISGSTYTWSNRSANMPDYPNGNLSGVDPLTVQGGYDMLVKVFPTDPNIVFISGSNLYRSSDGFATTGSIAWINGYAGLTDASSYPNGHPDVHELVFNPANPSEAICGNDGGIQMTSNVNAGTGSFILKPVTWNVIPNYQTLQYYYVAMDPDANRNNFIGGAQDNGVHVREKIQLFAPLLDSNDHRALTGGDGCAVGISKVSTINQTQFLYASAQLGHVYRIPVQNPNAFAQIQPNNLTKNPDYSSEPGGEFVTNFKLDQDNTEDMYYVNFNRLFRTTSASSVSAGGWTELTGVSAAASPSNPTGATDVSIHALAFSAGPYNSSHSMYIGTSQTVNANTGVVTRQGKILRLDGQEGAAATTAPIDITPGTLTGNVQNIAVNPNNDNEILAVVSNYNAVGIWWTNNAKAAAPTWVNAEGNLTLPSIRSCAIVVKKDASNNPVTEYYVGTSIGLYSTTNIAGGNITWQREGGQTLNFAVVQHMAYRPVDNVLVLGTHGNGMFYTFIGTPNYTPNSTTGITPVTNDRNFIKTVYPTLVSNSLRFETGNMIGIKKLEVRLTDVSGKVVYRKETSYVNGSVDVSPFAAGAYILTIYSDDNRYRHVQKIIKQ